MVVGEQSFTVVEDGNNLKSTNFISGFFIDQQ